MRIDPASGREQADPREGLDGASSVQLPQLVDVDGQAPPVHATMTPRPTVTSQAATTMTMIAKIWPSPLPCMRLKAMSARFAALSISSRQSRMTSGLRRVRTPAAPMQKTIAETARYQPMFTGRSPLGRAGPRAARRRRAPVACRSAGRGPRASSRCPAARGTGRRR